MSVGTQTGHVHQIFRARAAEPSVRMSPGNWRCPDARRIALTRRPDVAVVDAGDGVAEMDGDVSGEAGGESEHLFLPRPEPGTRLRLVR